MPDHMIENVVVEIVDQQTPNGRVKILVFTKAIPVPIESHEVSTDEEGNPITFKMMPYERWLFPMNMQIAKDIGNSLASDIIVDPMSMPSNGMPPNPMERIGINIAESVRQEKRRGR